MVENSIEILLVEDNPNDVELTLHALKKNNKANSIHVARDGRRRLNSCLVPESISNATSTDRRR